MNYLPLDFCRGKVGTVKDLGGLRDYAVDPNILHPIVAL